MPTSMSTGPEGSARDHEPKLITLDGVDFAGCSSNRADGCNCETWAPTECDACGEEMHDSERAYLLSRPTLPWLPNEHADQEWEVLVWHEACDEREPRSPEVAA